MVNDVKYLLNNRIEDIISSSDCLILIKTWSKLYNSGLPCRACSNSQRRYYSQLKQNGLIMAQKYEDAQKRTCIPNWKGLKYISATAKHWDSTLITDEEALYLIEKGFLNKECFLKLPIQEEKEIIATVNAVDIEKYKNKKKRNK